MLQTLRDIAAISRRRCPTLAGSLETLVRRLFGRWIGTYPRVLANEVGAVRDVLYSSRWNMAYGQGLVHERLEEAFCRYLGASNAIAVNTGGMALQMAMRVESDATSRDELWPFDTRIDTATLSRIKHMLSRTQSNSMIQFIRRLFR